MSAFLCAWWVSLLSILLVNGSHLDGNEEIAPNDVVCHTTNDTKGPLPTFPKEFDVHLEVTDLYNNYTSEYHESVHGGHVQLTRTSSGKRSTCVYNALTKTGHIIQGVHCSKGSNLPHHCFCHQTCVPFVPLSNIFAYLEHFNGIQVSESLGVRGIPVSQWSARCWNQHNPNVTLSMDVFLTKKDYPTPLGLQLVPVRVAIYARGDLLRILDPNVHILQLVYEVTAFTTLFQPDFKLQTPPGMYCPSESKDRTFPSLADQFSVTMETAIAGQRTLTYIHHQYDSLEKLVSYQVRPRNSDYHPSMALNRLYDLANPAKFYRVIHDFKSGIEYMIDEETGNCSMATIPLVSLDAVAVDQSHVRLRHVGELLEADDDQFIYSGQRVIRGIPCDVWVAEKKASATHKEKYTTVEVYFTKADWTVEAEAVNRDRQVPIGVSTYTALSPDADSFTCSQHTYYYGYRSRVQPNWEDFEISTCLSRTNRIFLVITLQVSYSQLLQHNLHSAQDSMRRAIAGIAGVSPLRISNIYVGKSHDHEVDVWFVLLERPDVVGNVANPQPQIYMADAYRVLQEITDHHDININLDLGAKQHSRVRIKRGSLEMTTEAMHPNTRHKGPHYLKAGYTAGSMAGLGFSMAILGTCVGVFIGFLLWKRGTGIPYKKEYHVHD